MQARAFKDCTCQRCGHTIAKGEPIRFEAYFTQARHHYGSGRSFGGGERKSRPIHLHDCNGWDAAQEKARQAATPRDMGREQPRG